MRKKKTNSRVTEHLMVLFEKEVGTERRAPAPAPAPRAQPAPVRPSRREAPRVASRPGRGAVSGRVAGLAARDPQELLKKLGIVEIKGENDLQKIVSVLSQAVNNETMRKAFEAPKTDPERQIIRIPIISKEITPREGSVYIRYTLKAASVIMSLSGRVTIIPGDGVVEVQSMSIA